jgi:hypothetical protein
MILDCIPAYGRTFSIDDWNRGEDFKIIDGPYFSIRDIERLSQDYVGLVFYDNYYNGLTTKIAHVIRF